MDDADQAKEKKGGYNTTNEDDDNECLKEEFDVQKLKSFHNFNDMITHNISTCCYCIKLPFWRLIARAIRLTANEGAKLENIPEDCKGFPFVLFKGVGHHDFTLGGPCSQP
jgi:hypothetical protein